MQKKTISGKKKRRTVNLYVLNAGKDSSARVLCKIMSSYTVILNNLTAILVENYSGMFLKIIVECNKVKLKENKFYTRPKIKVYIFGLKLAKIPTIFPDWWRSLILEKG